MVTNPHTVPCVAEPWALGAALLQLSTHDIGSQRHAPLAVQQLLLRGLQAPSTLPASLHALADLAVVLEVQVCVGGGGNLVWGLYVRPLRCRPGDHAVLEAHVRALTHLAALWLLVPGLCVRSFCTG